MGGDPRYDAHLASLRERLAAPPPDRAGAEWETRRLVEDMALALQAGLLLQSAPPAISSAFCAARLEGRGLASGDLPRGIDGAAIVERALAV